MGDEGAIRRRPIPEVAALLFIGVGVGVGLVTLAFLRSKGQVALFFDRGDARMYWLTAHDLFGTGRGFSALGRASEVPYRYGRVGLPLLAWLLAFGQPQLIGPMLIAVNVVALAAVPALAAVLIDDYGGNPVRAVLVLLVPGLLVLTVNVVAEPLLIATVLLAFVLDRRGHSSAALGVMAFAILVKEIAVLALVPWVWRAVRGRDGRALRRVATTLIPYASWCLWLRVRVGEFPFRAHTNNRTDALSLPFVGLRDVSALGGPDFRTTVGLALATVVLGVAAAWVARSIPLGALAGAFALPTICLGVQALRFEGEAIRLLAVPQVFALVALAAMLSGPNRLARRRARDTDARDVAEPV